MCMIYVPWHINDTNSRVVIEDDEGCFVGTMKNATVASNVVNQHNRWLADNMNPPNNGWVSARKPANEGSMCSKTNH